MTATLVTGGAGLIGSHLCDALLRLGHRVRVLDDLSTGARGNLAPPLRFGRGRCRQRSDRARRSGGRGPHLPPGRRRFRRAVNEDRVGAHRANQTGTVAVLDAVRALGRIPCPTPPPRRSTATNQGAGAIRGDAPPSPRTAYGADKFGSELHARVAFGVRGVPSCRFRFFNVFGPRHDPASPCSGVISIFADHVARRLPIVVHGGGLQACDFVYVADVVAHLLASRRHATAEPQAAVFNVCTGRATDLPSLAAAMGDLTSCEPEIRHGPARPVDIRDSLGCPRNAAARLGVRADTRLDAGQRATLSAGAD